MARSGWAAEQYEKSRAGQQGKRPDFMKEAPLVDPRDMVLLEAFFELSTCRPYSPPRFLGPIPWTAIVAYAAELGLLGHVKRFFNQVIRGLDECFLEVQRQKME